MAGHPSPEYLRKIRNDIANYRATVSGLEDEIRRYKEKDDDSSVRSVRSMREEMRRIEQMIENLESQL